MKTTITKNTLFKCVDDLQGGAFQLGKTCSVEAWRARFLQYAFDEELEEIIEPLKKLSDDKIMDFIAEVWQLTFKPFKPSSYQKLKQRLEYEQQRYNALYAKITNYLRHEVIGAPASDLEAMRNSIIESLGAGALSTINYSKRIRNIK